MNKSEHGFSLSGLLRLAGRCSALALLALSTMTPQPTAAQAAVSSVASTTPTVDRTTFDHLTTGFELIGQHRDLACELCHVNAIFKGTPRDCASCHGVGTQVKATIKPKSHILSTNRCESCHTPVAWNPAVNFDHAEVQGSCSSCHNNVQAQGKGPTHISTDLECDACHSTIGWAGAVFNHPQVTTGCVRCHGPNLTAKGMPDNHAPIGAAGCESCHTPTYYLSFMFTNASGTAPPSMVHTAAGFDTTNCITCHEMGVRTAGSPATKVRPAVKASGSAHVATGQCSDCHLDKISFKGATDYPANHIPLPNGGSAVCTTCHTNPASFLTYTMNHTVVSSESCASCHGAGLSFAGMAPPTLVLPPSNHVSYLPAGCESCHLASSTAIGGFKFTNVSGTAPAAMVHTAVSSFACATCHAAGKTDVGVPATLVMPGTHVPIGGATCESCHLASGTATGGFKLPSNVSGTAPPSMVHAAVASAACATCHAAGKTDVGVPATIVTPANHIPFGSATCQSCHLASSTATGGFKFTNVGGTAPPAMVHAAVTGIVCSTCHEKGQTDVGVPVTIVRPLTEPHSGNNPHPASGECSDCHSTITFIGASNYPANHIPLTSGKSAPCATCHTDPSNNFAKYTMAAPGHALVSNTCETCHAAGRSFANIAPPALVQPPANHVPFGAAACTACHSNSNFTQPGGFRFANASGTAPAAMVHSAVTGIVCSTCHEKGKTDVGAPATVVRPLTEPHSGNAPHPASGECSDCHKSTTTFIGATNYPANHIPLTNGQSAPCATCHNDPGNDFAKYTMGTPGHALVSNTCETCHAAGKSFANIAAPALVLPPGNHVPFGTAACTVCHSNSNFMQPGGFKFSNASGTAPPAMVHTAVASMTCATCHATGKVWAGTPATVLPPSNHIPFGAAACEGCHLKNSVATGGFKFTNATGTAPPSMVHSLVSGTVCSTCHEAGKTWVGTPITVVRPAKKADNTVHVAAGECSTCHLNTTSFKGATDLPSNHIPLPAADANNCSLCHTTAGNYSLYVMNHVNITGNCAQCHAYGLSFANMAAPTLKQPPSGPTGHIPSNPPNGTAAIACELCHLKTVFTTFAGTKMIHAAVRTMTCMSCHELGMQWKTNTGVRLWVRDGANHYKGQDCGGSGCHSTRDKYAARRAAAVVTRKAGVVGAAAAVSSVGATAGIGGAAAFNHQRVAGTACVSCHGPTTTIGKPGTHIATSDACASCHTTLSWLPIARVDHLQVKGSCVSCHNKVIATGKGSTHIASGDGCETCHTTNAWTPARFDHNAVVAHTCNTCHNGLRATGLPSNHVPTSAQCDTCHGTLGWKPAKLDHRILTAHCVTCHNNTVALGVTAAHMSTQRDCATCHTYPDWTVSHFVHVSASYPGDHKATLTCVSCHASNTDQIPWLSPGDAGSCAGCHAKDFKPELHAKTSGGLKYTAGELHNCAGACHVYSDATLGTVVKSLPGPYHRVSDATFKH